MKLSVDPQTITSNALWPASRETVRNARNWPLRRRASIASLLILGLLSFSAQAQRADHVIIISVDGLRPDAISQETSPTIEKLRREGVWAKYARTIPLSKTLPSHTSMLTGRSLEIHGITWNSYNEKKGLVKVPTCLELAHAQGKSTAMFVGKEKLKHLNRPGSLDYFSLPGDKAQQVVQSFVDYTRKNGLPNLTFIHLPDTDIAGHSDGWMSKAYLKALKDVDKVVEIVMSTPGVRSNAIVILTSDHGGLDKDHGDDIPVHRLIPWIAVGGTIKGGVVYKKPILTYDTAATALEMLGIKAPADWEGKAILLETSGKPASLPLPSPRPQQPGAS